MPTGAQESLQDAMNRREALQLSGRPHLPLTLSRRLMRHLGTIVRVLSRAVDHRRHHRIACGWVAARFVRELSVNRTCAFNHATYPAAAHLVRGAAASCAALRLSASRRSRLSRCPVLNSLRPTGGGKTTIINQLVLARFYDPVAGTVSIDGIDIDASRSGLLRDQIIFGAGRLRGARPTDEG